MNDFAFLAILVVFFALAVLFVHACDRLIGKDEDVVARGADDSALRDAA